MVTRQVFAAICRIGLLSAVALTVLPAGEAKAEPIVLVFDLRIDTQNDAPLSPPRMMNNVFVRFDNEVTATFKLGSSYYWTEFEKMQDTPSVPETPYTESLLAINPGWPYNMKNDVLGRQSSAGAKPMFSIGTSTRANPPDGSTDSFWWYYRSFVVQESMTFDPNEGYYFSSESLMAFLKRNIGIEGVFSFEEASLLYGYPTASSDPVEEYRDGSATLKMIAAKEVPLDIRPGSCPNPINLAARGTIPVAILGTLEFDVTSVNLETLRLEGVPPSRYSYSNVGTPFYSENEYSDYNQCSALGADGYLDLLLHFDWRAISQNLDSPGKHESRVLVLTGEMLDGTPFVARDVVKIIR